MRMVRTSFIRDRKSPSHRKRSRSKSPITNYKRRRSAGEYKKDCSRRRSRSRNRLRRSRSRERQCDKKVTETRVRSKPLMTKRRSFSRPRSRSNSKDKISKKDDKKDAKAEDEQFDSINFAKVPDKDDEDEWVVTDVIEEPAVEDNGNLEEEYDYEADEDDQYSHHSSSPLNNSCHNSPDRSSKQPEETSFAKENCSQSDNKEHKDSYNKENRGRDENSSEKNQNVRDRTSSIEKEQKHEVEHSKRSYSYYRSRGDSRNPELERLAKEQIKEEIKQDKELHQLRIKHELARHKAEMEVLEVQLSYWKNKK